MSTVHWPPVIEVEFVIKLCLVFLLRDNGLSSVDFERYFVTMCGKLNILPLETFFVKANELVGKWCGQLLLVCLTCCVEITFVIMILGLFIELPYPLPD